MLVKLTVHMATLRKLLALQILCAYHPGKILGPCSSIPAMQKLIEHCNDMHCIPQKPLLLARGSAAIAVLITFRSLLIDVWELQRLDSSACQAGCMMDETCAHGKDLIE